MLSRITRATPTARLMKHRAMKIDHNGPPAAVNTRNALTTTALLVWARRLTCITHEPQSVVDQQVSMFWKETKDTRGDNVRS